MMSYTWLCVMWVKAWWSIRCRWWIHKLTGWQCHWDCTWVCLMSMAASCQPVQRQPARSSLETSSCGGHIPSTAIDQLTSTHYRCLYLPLHITRGVSTHLYTLLQVSVPIGSRSYWAGRATALQLYGPCGRCYLWPTQFLEPRQWVIFPVKTWFKTDVWSET